MPDEMTTPLEDQGQGIVPDQSPPEEGQGEITPSDDGQGYYYSYTDPVKNEVKNFRTQEELDGYVGNLNKSYGELRKSYTQKTQEYAERKRVYENDRAEFNRRQSEFEQRKTEIERFDRFLKENPHVYREIKAKMAKGPTGSDINTLIEERVKEIYGKDFDDLKTHKERIEAERQREFAFKALKQKYPNINKAAVLEKFGELAQGDLSNVYELIHLAFQGNNQARIQQIKGSGGLLPAGSGNPSPGRPPANKSIDDWVESLQKSI